MYSELRSTSDRAPDASDERPPEPVVAGAAGNAARPLASEERGLDEASNDPIAPSRRASARPADALPPSAPSPGPVPEVRAKGNVERIEDGVLTGWIARTDNLPLNEPVSVWVNGRRTATIARTTYREDLALAGVAAGNAGFSVGVGLALGDGSRALEIALSTGTADAPEFLLRRTLEVGDHHALNSNPYLRPAGPGAIDGWRLDHDLRAGVLVDSFPMVESFSDVAARYTRLSFPDPTTADAPLVLRCPVELNRDPEDDLALALLLRADRSTEIDCTLRRNGVAVSQVRAVADGGWNRLTRPLPDTRTLKARDGAQLSLELSLRHRGGGFVDVGFCYLAEDPSMRYLRRAHRDPAEPSAVAPRNFVANGELVDWSRGVRFAPPLAGRETADGWWIEGESGDLTQVRVCADVARGGGIRASGEPRFGMRVSVGETLGAVRVVAAVDRRVIDCPSAGGELVLDAVGPTRLARVRRVSLRAVGLGREATARVFEDRLRVRGRSAIALDIDEASMVGVRRACVGTGTLQLAIELEPGSELFVERAELGQGRTSLSVSADAPESAGAPFEDPNIAEQIPLLNGLESWTEGDGPVRSEAIEPPPAPDAGDLSSWVVPEVRRPHVGYPNVDVVVPVHNALDFVKVCVRSVVENTTVPHGLVIVDDGSDRATRDWLREVAARFPHVSLLVNDRNLGYTRTVNRGLEHSMADQVCVLNSDCEVTPDWLTLMIDCARHADGIGMVGPLSNAASFQSVPRIREGDDWCLNPLGPSQSPADIAARVRRLSEARWPAVRVLNGFCQLISREALDAVGSLDEEAFPTGFGEENDFCARLVAAGFTLHVVDDAYVFHAKSKSFGHERRRALSQQGGRALAKKHPHIDWGLVTAELENNPSLVRLRERLAAQLQ